MTHEEGDAMKELATDVQMLRGFPPNAINVYLVGDVLIDAATRQAQRRILRQISGRTLGAHALTHAHPDHQGSSHAVCERLGIPLWCGQGDVPAMETPGGIKNPKAPGWLNALQGRCWTGPPHPVARALHEGDEVAGFTVLGDPRALRRPRLLLARIRPRADPRRRAGQHELHHRHPGSEQAAGHLHARPCPQPRVGAAPGRAAPGAGVLRSRRAAARPGQARGLRQRVCRGERREHLRSGRRGPLRADRARPRPVGSACAARRGARRPDRLPRSSAWSPARSCRSRA